MIRTQMRENGKAIDVVTFENHLDLLMHLESFPEHLENGSSHRITTDKSWVEQGWDETLELLRSGWAKGVDAIDIIAEQIKTTINEDATEYLVDYEVTGDFLDVGRVLEGVPETFGFIEAQEQPREELNIIINLGASAGCDAKLLYNRGAVVVAIIDQLQAKYFLTVTVITETHATGWNLPRNIRMEVKLDMQNDYSRDLLAFYVANSGMLRRVSFAVREMNFDTTDLGTYGHSENHGNVPEGTLHFKKVGDEAHCYKTLERSIARCEEILKQFNGRC